MQSTSVRSGFVTILGRPSSGKSSLVNALCGEKVSIVSPVPQTTRNTIRGIYHDERGQIVFLDTPGLHDSEKKPNLRMRSVALDSTGEADALLYTVDTSRAPGEEERSVAEIISGSTLPRVVVLTKCDLSGGPSRALAVFLQEHGLSELPQVQTGGLVAEGDHRGLKQLLDQVFQFLPEGEPWYPLDYYTDQEPAFRIAEIIREQAILRTRQEVPHALYVEVADLEQDEKALRARVFLCVERSSQQGILVGRGGETVTAIRKESERILNKIFPQPVRLQLQVKVRPRWRRDDAVLKKLIR